MYAEERQQAIARLVSQRGRVSVNQLAREYDVTTETVRRDLSTLERMGLVRRVHGGVVPPSSISLIEAGLRERDLVNTETKERIARAALELLPPANGTIVLDAGTTTSRLASLLPLDHPLTVVTHAVPIAARLAGQRHLDLRLLPGRVRRTTQAAVGADTVEALSHLRVDVTFVGTNGVTPDHGLTTPDPDEAAVKRALIGAGRQVVAVADASKFGIETAVRFAAPGEIDVLVTDSAVSTADRRALAKAGVEVVVA
ncbi:MAG TPA: DeoR/GlpR family DNA-binding transcription regulator [Nocardioides sp.]|jgi:DeoR family fructose operon transcriptional repressor|uniref:DeoR/GlpR family DNA-binding transcription regulator n=1 Tax=Nocardioides sp. TaxID=35761 RepID=UPI002E374ABD|nr:DeoR/GlpR family DNA-binding transcription regulator [Nocardioides sp.]HEX3930962.1 DeoR/GlpR family DNA-binding transcription regulator [Nocardioides sp.]